MELVGNAPEAWVFASENPSTPMWRANVWYPHMKPKLETVGLEWATFQVLRRTHAGLRHDIGIDPKVAAHQRGMASAWRLTYTPRRRCPGAPKRRNGSKSSSHRLTE
jgi:hypothetical protein